MATVQDLLKKVKKSLADTANATVLSPQWRGQVANQVKTAAPILAKDAVQTFAAPSSMMGRGVGFAIKAPFELKRLQKEAETDRVMQDMLNRQSKRALEAGNIDQSRKLSQKAGQYGERSANNWDQFGKDVGQARKDTISGTVGTAIQLLGAKGLTPKAAMAYGGGSAAIGGVVHKATGGSFAEGAGKGLGNSLSFRGVNKITQPATNAVISKVGGLPMVKRIIAHGAANAAANLAEDEVLTRTSQQRPATNQERASSAVTGFVIGGFGGIKKPAQIAPASTATKTEVKQFIERTRKDGTQYRQSVGKGGFGQAEDLKNPIVGFIKDPNRPISNIIVRNSDVLSGRVEKSQIIKTPTNGSELMEFNDGPVAPTHTIQKKIKIKPYVQTAPDLDGKTSSIIKKTTEDKIPLSFNEKTDNYSRLQETVPQNLDSGTSQAGNTSRAVGNVPSGPEIGWKDIRSSSAKNAVEVGSLLKDFRNPREETLHFVYVKNGQVIAHNAISDQSPNSVALSQREIAFNIQDRLKRLDADGFYIAHNHPSGRPDPSDADASFTQRMSQLFREKMKGSLVLDHDKMAIISPDPRGSHILKDVDLGKSYQVDAPKITNPKELISAVETHWNKDEKLAGLFIVNTKYQPIAYEKFNPDGKTTEQINDTIRQFIRKHRGVDSFIAINDKHRVIPNQKAINEIGVRDVVSLDQNGNLVSFGDTIRPLNGSDQILDTQKGFNKKNSKFLFDKPETLYGQKSGDFTHISQVQPSIPTEKSLKPGFDPNNIDSPGYASLKGYNDLRQRGYSQAQLDKMGPTEVIQALKQNIAPFEHPSFTKAYPGSSSATLPGDEFSPYTPKMDNKPVKADRGRYEQLPPTKEEVEQTVASSNMNEMENSGVNRWFNKIFNPLKNAPQEVQSIMQEWRNRNLVSRAQANEVAKVFSDIPEEDGWKLIQYMQKPNSKKAAELGFDPQKYGPQLTQLRNFYDTVRQQGIDSGLEVKYLENYLNQIWKETPGQIEAKIKAGAGGKPAWAKNRKIFSYQEGMELGLTPRFTHPAQLAAHYSYQLDKALSNQRMVDELIKTELLLPSSQAPADWKTIDSPFFPKVQIKFGQGENVVMDYKAPPDIARALNNIFDVSEPGALSIGQKISKTAQEFALSGGIPFTPVNSFTLANMQKEAMTGRIRGPIRALTLSFSDNASKSYFDQNQDAIKDMASEGIRIYTNNDYTSMYKNLAENKSLTKRIFGNASSLFNDAFNEPTFKRFMPILQIEFYKDAFEGAIKNGLEPAEAKIVAADATRNFYGITDAFSRPTQTEEVLSTFMMAPAFRESMINFWGNTMKSVDPRTWSDPAFDANRKFIVGSALTYALYTMANMAINGRPMHENKGGKELSLELPLGGGRSFFLPYQFTIGTVPRRFIEATGELKDGDIAGAAQKFSSFASIPVNALTTTITNRNFYGAPISKEDDPPFTKAGKQIAAGAGQMMHPWIRTGIELSTGQRTMKEAWPGMLELPLYPSASSDVAHLRGQQVTKFKQLDSLDPSVGQAYAQQVKTDQSAGEVAKAQQKAIQQTYSTETKPGFFGNLFGGKQEEISDISQLDIPEKEQKALIKEKVELGAPVSADEYMIHFDLSKYQTQPTDPIKAARQDADKYKSALSVYRDETLPDGVKSELISRMNIDEADLAYYDIASDNTRDVRRIFAEQYLVGLDPNQNKVEALSLLRKEVRGARILGNEVIDDLVDLGHISESEGKQLKKIIWDEQGKKLTTKKGSGKKLSIKNVSISSGSTRGISTPKMQQVNFGGGERQGLDLSVPQRQMPKVKLKQLQKSRVRIAPIQYQPLQERKII